MSQADTNGRFRILGAILEHPFVSCCFLGLDWVKPGYWLTPITEIQPQVLQATVPSPFDVFFMWAVFGKMCSLSSAVHSGRWRSCHPSSVACSQESEGLLSGSVRAEVRSVKPMNPTRWRKRGPMLDLPDRSWDSYPQHPASKKSSSGRNISMCR